MGDVYYLLKLNILLRSYLITNLLVKYGRGVFVYNLKGFSNLPIKIYLRNEMSLNATQFIRV